MAKRIAVLLTNGFEQVEMTEPKKALEQAGMQVDLVSPESDTIRGWNHTEWGDTFKVDVPLNQAKASDYDGLVLPGGVMNPDHLRRDENVQQFVRAFFEAGKPVGAICHAPWTLIDAGVVKGRKLTSYHTLQTDLKNAGANWVDQEVVVDQGLVTSRNPDDLPAFNAKLIEEFREGVHEGQHA
ncbi:type 1 glutamine amidotransferase [Phototrophicus methaneseepsis]|uniref:Type 1 glutamine amidotransferase n=1 Tax=Phototrophicus methaneseepsis TaxID=2710758 RepID=A0A7S8EBR0_9CHLR|nr:type 1 glutamine amidotransferase domain-containing protein [Phototrophicus methaneseepsis]QPC84048.1 type 1 glutamine amidotransferase [Phototrophicus methaneseepsis]